jgi:hypothetical protein
MEGKIAVLCTGHPVIQDIHGVSFFGRSALHETFLQVIHPLEVASAFSAPPGKAADNAALTGERLRVAGGIEARFVVQLEKNLTGGFLFYGYYGRILIKDRLRTRTVSFIRGKALGTPGHKAYDTQYDFYPSFHCESIILRAEESCTKLHIFQKMYARFGPERIITHGT